MQKNSILAEGNEEKSDLKALKRAYNKEPQGSPFLPGNLFFFSNFIFQFQIDSFWHYHG
jgi:hypothetical protein